MSGRSAAAVFQPPPRQWGLRGDPYLWAAMQQRFVDVSPAISEEEFAGRVRDEFARLVGCVLGSAEHTFVREYAHGGMSSGGISHEFWSERALPMLCARLRAQQAQQD